MSGLCGWIDGGRSGSMDPGQAVASMMSATPYRGPDGEARWTGEGAALGHQTLHLTPESVSDPQPLVDRKRGLTLVADIRLDNRDELAGLLGISGNRATPTPADLGRSRQGSQSTAASDARILLAAYRRWGSDTPQKLLGDFAFAVWDSKARTLFAARDPMGMRGLFYRSSPSGFGFGTEVKQLLSLPDVQRTPFEPAVAMYLSGEAPPPGTTFWQGIEELQPGFALSVEQGVVRTWRFWAPDPGHQVRYHREQEYAEHFRELLVAAVRDRLRTRRKTGVLLSGGMDSSSIMGAAGWLKERSNSGFPELAALSWAFEDLTQCDERHISQGLTRHYDIPDIHVPVDRAWPLKNYPSLAPDLDEPFLFAHYEALEVSYAAARDRGIGLIMSGDRGDLVAGMSIFDFPALLRSGRWIRLLREMTLLSEARGVSRGSVIRNELLRPARIKLLPPGVPLSRLPLLGRLANPSLPPPPPWVTRELVDRTDLTGLRHRHRHSPTAGSHARSERHEAIFLPIHMRGVAFSERSHARFGQGFADPWSDRRLVEFVLAIPQRLLNRVDESKRLTRMAMTGIIPGKVLGRIDKILPTPLFHRGFRQRETARVMELFNGSRAATRGWIDEQAFTSAYRDYLASGEHSPLHWAAVTVEMWLRRHSI